MKYNKQLEQLLNMFNNVSELEANSIINDIYAKLSKICEVDSSVHSLKSDAISCCKHCGSLHFVKNGTDRHHHTRYLCRDCNRTFSATSHSIVSGTHKDAVVWKKYIRCLLDGYSIAKSAEYCKIGISTAFYWRHKILHSLSKSSVSDNFDGLLEMDEMYIKISYKGNHDNNKFFAIPRKSFKRGSDNCSPGNSNKACVLCVAERGRAFSGKVVCKGNLRDTVFPAFFDNKVKEDAIVMSDGHRSYNQYFRDKAVEHVVLPSASGKKAMVRGAYHINNVNALHHRFRAFLRRYNGVATKYLQNYLSFFLWLENHKKGDVEKALCSALVTGTEPFSIKDMAMLVREPDFAPAFVA